MRKSDDVSGNDGGPSRVRKAPRRWVEPVLLFIGLAFLSSTLPVFPPTYWAYVSITTLFEGTRFITAASLSTMVCAILLAIVILVRPRTPTPRFSTVAACGLLYFAGLVLVLSVGSVIGRDVPVASICLGVVFGVGTFALLAAWMRALRCDTIENMSYRAIALAIPAFVLAALGLHFAVYVLPDMARIPLLCVFALGAGLAPVAIVGRSELLMREGDCGDVGDVRDVPVDDRTWLDLITPDKDEADMRESERERAGMLGGLSHRAAFYVGAPITIFVMYFASSYALQTQSFPTHFGDIWAAVACMLTMVPCIARNGASVVAFSFRVFLPLLGVAFLGVTTLMPDDLELVSASACSLVLSFACGFMLLGLLIYLVSRRMRQFMLPLTCLLSFMEAALMMMPYYKVHLLSLGSYIPTFLICVLVASLGFFTFSPSLYGWRELFSYAQAAPAPSAMGERVRVCDDVARRYGLSPRETEILQYLGRGYGPSYLATILPIKENTIRSHVRNIYSKLEVRSRGELLELIDEAGQAGAEHA
ncbi:MAG: helix-turn-helix transcriptional regulator [Coriobacteriia bacterium]|nr:helix-turn-helix transcriptional regulator [Coriobacteriia bacterium]